MIFTSGAVSKLSVLEQRVGGYGNKVFLIINKGHFKAVRWSTARPHYTTDLYYLQPLSLQLHHQYLV
jgi:hypothetical protein